MDQSNQIKSMTPRQALTAMGGTLDKLADTTNGRARCGLIWVMNELLNQLDTGIASLENRIKLLEEWQKGLHVDFEPDEKGEQKDEEGNNETSSEEGAGKESTEEGNGEETAG